MLMGCSQTRQQQQQQQLGSLLCAEGLARRCGDEEPGSASQS